MQQKFERALFLHQQGKLEEAEQFYLEILRSDANHDNALHFLGLINYQTGRFQQASDFIKKAIEINPNNADYFYNLGTIFQELKQYDLAIVNYNKAIDINPDDPDYYYNRALILQELNSYDLAVEGYSKAIQLRPNHLDSYINLGNSLSVLKRTDLAIISYQKAILFGINSAELHVNYGNALLDAGRLSDAIEAYKIALKINQNFKFLLGKIFHVKTKLCYWEKYQENINEIETKILNKNQVIEAFPLIAMSDSLKLHLLTAQMFIKYEYPRSDILGVIPKRDKSSKIKIGYYSADFHRHATSYLMAEMFELHDRSKFELIAFSFGPESDDEMQKRIKKSFDKFIDVRLKSDNEIVKLSRDIGIDIAVDLKGFTKDTRLGIFAKRAAPIQVSYLGYPGTLGAEYMDYIIADKVLIPDEYHRRYYSEKVVYMPYSYQVNDSKRVISDRVWTRKEFGLPEGSFVFCCFNNNYKITPFMFDVWINILRKVPNSVLWLLEDNATAADNLRKEAKKRGIDSTRIIFAKRVSLDEHLSRHNLADLFLDTIPCNAHTTCSDALWAGLPVLTVAGESFASRVSASLLNAMNLSELITDNLEDYESKAVEFATNKEQLQEIKTKLKQNKLTAPLFDTRLFTGNLECAYEVMYNRYHKGLMPEDIEIPKNYTNSHL